MIDNFLYNLLLTSNELLNLLDNQFAKLVAQSNAAVVFIKSGPQIDVIVSTEYPKIKLKFNTELAKVLGIETTYTIAKKTSIPIKIKDEDIRQVYLDTFQQIKTDTSLTLNLKRILPNITSLLANINITIKSTIPSDVTLVFYESNGIVTFGTNNSNYELAISENLFAMLGFTVEQLKPSKSCEGRTWFTENITASQPYNLLNRLALMWVYSSLILPQVVGSQSGSFNPIQNKR